MGGKKRQIFSHLFSFKCQSTQDCKMEVSKKDLKCMKNFFELISNDNALKIVSQLFYILFDDNYPKNINK